MMEKITGAKHVTRLSLATSQLTQLLRSLANVEEKVNNEDFDRLVILMTQATKSIEVVVEFLLNLSTSLHSNELEHFVETPKNVSKRRKKKPGGSGASSFELSFDGTDLDLKDNFGDLESSRSSFEKIKQEDPSYPSNANQSDGSPLDEVDSRRSPNVSLQVCDKNLDQSLKAHDTPGAELFSEPVSPIANLHPSEEFSASQLEDDKLQPTAVNSTFNSFSVGRESDKENRPRVSFAEADFFYFQRCQGWVSVPRDGGNSLGMSESHFHYQRLSLRDASDSADRSLQESKLNKKSSPSLTETNQQLTESEPGTSCHLVTPCEDSLLESDGSFNTSRVGKKGELGTIGLQRMSSRKRRTLLKSCSVQLDPSEAEELRKLRCERDSVGCRCYGGSCHTDTCSCVQAGVQCHQVQRHGSHNSLIFTLQENEEGPCSCSESACRNPVGRYKFDETKVQIHYMETLMGERLQIA